MPQKFLTPGTLIGGKYRLARPIGVGGFSEVYRGVHTSMNRDVAIKIFDPDDGELASPERIERRRARFQREARLVSQLDHPNTVTTFDFGIEQDGKLYLVMEFIEGATLKSILSQQGSLDEDRAITIFLQILGSLEQAHHLGILHRDLKPANIMLATNFKGEEIVKVLDFGVAEMLSKPQHEISASGNLIFVGTPRYAAPEQLSASDLSFATDIFGVGAMFWESLLGDKMVPSPKLEDCVVLSKRDKNWTVPPESSLRLELANIVEKAVQKQPLNRYQSATEMIAALQNSTTIQLEDLPEIQPSPFSKISREILDPNITHPDDSENFFLQGGFDSEEAPLATSSAKPPTRPVNKRHLPSPKKSTNDHYTDFTEGLASPVNSDQEPSVSKKPQRPAPAHPKRARQSRRSPQQKFKDRLNDYDPFLVFGGLAVSVVAMILLAIFLMKNPDSPPDESLIEQESSAEKQPNPALTNRSPFSVDGVQMAIRSVGWRVDDSRSPVNMGNFRYHPMVISRGDMTLDVTIYETDSQNTLDGIISAVEFPSESITLGHIAVRLNPRDNESNEPANILRGHLATYRDLVDEESAQSSTP